MPDPKLPTGTITFLFTDIQGSTMLWQQHPQEMPSALARHHALLRQAIESHGGHVFQIIGDAFCAAFATAHHGLLAAVAAQRALQSEPWGEVGAIRVRMALHSGSAEVQPGDYVSGEYLSSLTLSRTARLLSAGHGGQILLSMPSAELILDHLPDEVRLLDLGAHRLKDLVRPEHIFQANAVGLPAQFPALKSLDARPHNLPVQLTSFIGRQQELADIRSILQQARLLTITGIGGTGKTRLALQIAADLIEEFPDGAWFADFSPLTDPQLVGQTVASLWELRDQPGRSHTEILKDFLRSKKLLLVLDNCEHLVEASANLAQAILQASPGVKLLATSREPLGVPGENVFRVSTLSLPDATNLPSPDELLQYEAVRLFVDRVKSVRPDFQVNADNAPAIAQICCSLDGIPLAIELAAARTRAFSVEQIARRILDRFRLLTGGSRTSLPRHQTLRSLIDWSFQLLSAGEQALFTRLAIFQGGWDLEEVESACSGEAFERNEVFDLLARLVDRSLVMVDEAGDQPRYRLLDVLRQYAGEALAASGAQAIWQGRHMATYLKLASEITPRLRSTADLETMKRLDRDLGNLRFAYETAQQTGDVETALRLSAALHYYLYRSGHIQEALKYLETAVSMPGAQKYPLELSQAFSGLGLIYWLNGAYHKGLDVLTRSIELASASVNETDPTLVMTPSYCAITYMRLGNFQAAQDFAERSLRLAQKNLDVYGIAFANYVLGRIHLEQGLVPLATPYLQQALEWSRKAGDRLVISLVLNSLELVAVSAADFATALELNRESLELARQMKDQWMVSGALREAGNIAQAMGEYDRAAQVFMESAELSRQLGLLNDLARVCFNLGVIAVLQGALPAGQSYLDESWQLFTRLENVRGQSEVLDGWSAYAFTCGELELAACLQGTASASFEKIGAGRWPVDILEYQKVQAAIVHKLGGNVYQAAYSKGRALSPSQALEEALRTLKLLDCRQGF